jgi:hypothetical protein
MPIINPKMIKTALQRLGDLKRKETQYEKPAAAGPKRKSSAMTPENVSASEVVNTSILKANINITVIHKGI